MPSQVPPVRTVAVLVHDGVTMMDVAGPADVLAHATSFGARYETRLVSVDGCDAVASNGLTLVAGGSATATGPLDTVIVPGAYGMLTRPFPPALVDAVRDLAQRARRVASVCTGSFLLAEVGLLDGREATTHWSQSGRFRAAHPRVRVPDDVLFVRDGPVITSAGIGSGVDLALGMVEDDHGPGLARQVVRQMVLGMQRPGGLSQLPATSRAAVAADRPLRRLLDAVAADPSGRWSQDEMARYAGVSVRHLSRLFREELDTTPARHVEDVRLELARAFLQQGHTVAATARRTGLGSAETLRRVFRRRFGVSPSVYQAGVAG